jgi:hypothetical protein
MEAADGWFGCRNNSIHDAGVQQIILQKVEIGWIASPKRASKAEILYSGSPSMNLAQTIQASADSANKPLEMMRAGAGVTLMPLSRS